MSGPSDRKRSRHRTDLSTFAEPTRRPFNDELKGKKLVELESPDWREPMRLLFDEDWQRAGVRVPVLAPVENDEADENDEK